MTDIYYPPKELVTTDLVVTNVIIDRPWVPDVKHCIDIVWDPLPGDDCLGYNIYRSTEDVDNNYVQLNSTLLDITFYRDATATYQANTEYYYRITFVNAIGVESDVDETPTNRLRSELDNRGLINMGRVIEEILRRHTLILKSDGVDCDVLVRKMAGVKCTQCYNDDLDLTTEGTACRKCFGTSFIGGYSRIPDVRVRFHNNAIMADFSSYGITQKAAPKSWILRYPPLHNGDIIYKKYSSERYIISNVNRVLTQDRMTRQEFDANLLPSGDNRYFILPTG